MKSLNISTFAFVIILLLANTPLLAQSAPPATPIDGGLSWLLALGGAYGIKKLMKQKKQ